MEKIKPLNCFLGVYMASRCQAIQGGRRDRNSGRGEPSFVTLDPPFAHSKSQASGLCAVGKVTFSTGEAILAGPHMG